jgi:hypothetical protein
MSVPLGIHPSTHSDQRIGGYAGGVLQPATPQHFRA